MFLERLAHIAYKRSMSDENKTARIQLLMTPSEVKAVDDWSFDNRVRGRSEAIRILIGAGLEALRERRLSPDRKEQGE